MRDAIFDDCTPTYRFDGCTQLRYNGVRLLNVEHSRWCFINITMHLIEPQQVFSLLRVERAIFSKSAFWIFCFDLMENWKWYLIIILHFFLLNCPVIASYFNSYFRFQTEQYLKWESKMISRVNWVLKDATEPWKIIVLQVPFTTPNLKYSPFQQ